MRNYLENPITLQEIFNNAWEHFIVKGSPPSVEFVGGVRMCKYRGVNNNCCAIGLSLPDAIVIEGKAAGYISINFPQFFESGISNVELSRMQRRLHDLLVNKDGVWGCDAEEMKKKYIEVARDYNLTIPGEENERHEVTV